MSLFQYAIQIEVALIPGHWVTKTINPLERAEYPHESM